MVPSITQGNYSNLYGGTGCSKSLVVVMIITLTDQVHQLIFLFLFVLHRDKTS